MHQLMLQIFDGYESEKCCVYCVGVKFGKITDASLTRQKATIQSAFVASLGSSAKISGSKMRPVEPTEVSTSWTRTLKF